MAMEDPFESPDSVQMKGSLSGLTRLSRKVKGLVVLVIILIVGFVIFAIAGAGDEASPEPQSASGGEKSEQKPASGSSPASPNFGNVGSGQAVVVAQQTAAANNGLGPAFAVGGAGNAQGVPALPGAASTATAGPGQQVPLPTGGPASPQYQTPAEQEAERKKRELEQKRQQAIESTLDAGGADGGATTPSGIPTVGGDPTGQNPLLAQLAQAANAAAAAQGGGAAPIVPSIGGQQQDDQNRQVRKEQFLQASTAVSKTRLNEVKMPANSPYEIKAGWIIPAALECGLNSDLPGQTCARVTENVRDSATGRYLLIPQGSKLIGTYDSQIAFGQERILTVWTRLIFPDGSSISLEGMPGSDKAGSAGFDADVNNHYVKVLGSAAFMALFSAGIEMTQKQSVSTTGVQTNSQVIAQSVGQQLGQTGSAYIQKGMNIQPTLTREPGYKFNIVATRDIVFSSPYTHSPLIGIKK